MKKISMTILSLLLIIDVQLWASSFRITVPEKLVEENVTLLLYMLDGNGNQSVGKFHLDQNVVSRVILQQELEMTSCDDIALMQTSDLREADLSLDEQAVVVCFELDQSVQVIRILVVKDCLFDVDPLFDIVSLSFNALEFEHFYDDAEFDELSSLTQTLSEQSSETLANCSESHATWFDQYMAYAKIFVLMQYSKASRAVRGVSSWWN